MFSDHKQLINDSINLYAQHFLPGFKCVFKDADDGDRITQEEQKELNRCGINFDSSKDVCPDDILYNSQEDSLWFIEAVTSDGEVDASKFSGFEKICSNSNK